LKTVSPKERKAMAIINCPECGVEVSSRAAACVRCGFPIEEIHDAHVEQSDPPNQGRAFNPWRLFWKALGVIGIAVGSLWLAFILLGLLGGAPPASVFVMAIPGFVLLGVGGFLFEIEDFFDFR
jgi:hypothetical protein